MKCALKPKFLACTAEDRNSLQKAALPPLSGSFLFWYLKTELVRLGFVESFTEELLMVQCGLLSSLAESGRTCLSSELKRQAGRPMNAITTIVMIIVVIATIIILVVLSQSSHHCCYYTTIIRTVIFLSFYYYRYYRCFFSQSYSCILFL